MAPRQLELERQAFEVWLCETINIPEEHRENFLKRSSPCKEKYQGDTWGMIWQAWLARAQQSAWISVEERLPKINKEVLVVWTDGVFGFATRIESKYHEERWNWETAAFSETITHWQPLIEPPQDNTNGSAQ